MPTHLEEAALDVDQARLKDVLPYGCKPFLDMVSGCGAATVGPLDFQCAQGAPVDLAVRQMWHCRQDGPQGRNEVGGQLPCKCGADVVHRQLSAGIQRNIGGQLAFRACFVADDCDDGLVDTIDILELVLDLARFDPQTPDLDLIVETSMKFQRAIGAASDPVAGAVEIGGGPAGESVRHETLRRLAGAPQISARDAGSAEI